MRISPPQVRFVESSPRDNNQVKRFDEARPNALLQTLAGLRPVVSQVKLLLTVQSQRSQLDFVGFLLPSVSRCSSLHRAYRALSYLSLGRSLREGTSAS